MQNNQVTSFDRLCLTISLAILVHALIVLGVSFVKEDRPNLSYDMMEVVLVQKTSPESNDDAKTLAQASIKGGGNHDKKVKPSSPIIPPFPDSEVKFTMPPTIESASPPPTPPKKIDKKTIKPDSKLKEVEKLTIKKRQSHNEAVEKKQVAKVDTTTKSNTENKKNPPTKQNKTPSADKLLAHSFEIASLTAEIQRKLETKASRPRKTHISATNTKSYVHAAYMDAWRIKVERFGNLNYPQKARQNNLSGSLILQVAINKNGSINEITILESSGERFLDNAAINIVKLAAPYAKFSQKMKEDTDILYITRTWQFINNKNIIK